MRPKQTSPSWKPFRFRWLRLLGLASVLVALLVADSVQAKVFHSKESALERAFPRANRIEAIVLYLSSKEQAACGRLAAPTSGSARLSV